MTHHPEQLAYHAALAVKSMTPGTLNCSRGSIFDVLIWAWFKQKKSWQFVLEIRLRWARWHVIMSLVHRAWNAVLRIQIKRPGTLSCSSVWERNSNIRCQFVLDTWPRWAATSSCPRGLACCTKIQIMIPGALTFCIGWESHDKHVGDKLLSAMRL